MELRRQTSQVVTFRPDMSSPRLIGQISHVGALKYSYVMPGGPFQMSCLLAVPPKRRTDAMDPGRIVKIVRAGGFIWDGIIDEPTPSMAGYSILAHGSGTYGGSYLANWTTWNLNDPVNQAITRGLRWINPGISQGYLSPNAPDRWSMFVTDFLNQITVQAGLLWYIDRSNTLRVFTPPSVVDRHIISDDPNARTIVAEINSMWGKYVSGDDGKGNLTYAFSNARNQDSINAHQLMEYPTDLTPEGQMTGPTAQGQMLSALTKYQRVSFAGPFIVRYGQLRTPGGTPIDLAMDQAGTYARLLVTDMGYGGEVTPGPIKFVVGGYEYDDDSQTATITPWQSYRTDMAALLSKSIPKLRQ